MLKVGDLAPDFTYPAMMGSNSHFRACVGAGFFVVLSRG